MSAARVLYRFETVHPHGRGDNRKHLLRAGGKSGSPPRAWGQSTPKQRLDKRARFTPTGVGTMPYARRALPILPVHPHGRGDNARCNRDDRASCGSPPRAWGQYVVRASRHPNYRFTPTGVGTMLISAGRDIARAVHPHGRGDNNLPDSVKTTKGGSPPRAWGQCRRRRGTLRRVRFTPTGVGTILASQAF